MVATSKGFVKKIFSGYEKKMLCFILFRNFKNGHRKFPRGRNFYMTRNFQIFQNNEKCVKLDKEPKYALKNHFQSEISSVATQIKIFEYYINIRRPQTSEQ